MTTRRISDEVLTFVKRWEGLRLDSYECQGGVWTIGYGHTRTARPRMRITETEADRLLRADIANFERAVSGMVRVPLTDNQFGALVSWAFNVGENAASRSTLIRKLNTGDYDAVPSELMRWNKADGKVVNGLTNRRAAEAGLWARGSHVASAYVEASAKETVADALQTGTGRAAVGVGVAGVLAQLAPAIEALGGAGPVVGVAVVLAAVLLFVLWRKGRL